MNSTTNPSTTTSNATTPTATATTPMAATTATATVTTPTAATAPTAATTPSASSAGRAAGAVPSAMRAVVGDRYGDPASLAVRTVDVPTPSADQVLVRVEAAGADRGVWHLTTGLPYVVRLAGYGIRAPKQPVPGLDLSGVVVAVGGNAERFRVGDAVFGIGTGAYAQYAVADEAKLAHRPEGVAAEAAAVTAISGITALQAVRDAGAVQAGQRVLVLGASGGVGSFAVQLAAHAGAHVTGVASGSKLDLVRALGADDAIDYRADDALDGSRRYDVIIDTGGRNPVRRLRRALTQNGRLVIVGGEGGGRVTGGFGRQLRAAVLSPFVPQRLTMLMSAERGSDVEHLARLLAAGRLRPAVDRTYPLDDVPQALADLAAGRIRGKAAIRP